MAGKKSLQADIDLIREVYPITKAISYGNGCYELIRTAKKKLQANRPERGKIMSMTKKSLVRLMFMMQCTPANLGSMLTLTYPRIYPTDGEVVKRDINVVAQKIRRKEWSYVWFLEFQKRGAPHIHFLVEPDAVTPHMRVDFGLFWTARIAKSEWFWQRNQGDEYIKDVMKMARFNCHPGTFQVLREEGGAKKYATKYAAKEKQKKVPEKYKSVGRFWGASRDVKPKGVEFDVTEDEIEAWLVEQGHPAMAYELVPRHIWGIGDQNLVKPQKELHNTGQMPM